MPSYCETPAIWKLIQRRVRPFHSAAVVQESCQCSLITLLHLTPQVSAGAVRTALDVTGSIPPGNFPLLHHQRIIMCSTSPPQSHVQSKGCTTHTNTSRCTFSSPRWILIALLASVADSPPHFLSPAASASVIKNANWEWQSNREFHHRETERGGSAKIYGRESAGCERVNSLAFVCVHVSWRLSSINH